MSQKSSGSIKKAGAQAISKPPPDESDVEEKIKQYLVFQNFLNKNSRASTDIAVLRNMIRKFSGVLQICKHLRIRVFKRLFIKAHKFDGSLQSFLVKHNEILKNEKIMAKADTN